MNDRGWIRWGRPVQGLALALIWLFSIARGQAQTHPEWPSQFMPSSQVQPGMIGEGRTVVHGYEVESFKVEILGVQHNAMPGSDMILGKLDGAFLAGHGVVAGMSGSPVFIDGKLIGAVAYGWNFSYQPYCGITPIESMMSVWDNIGRPSTANHGILAQGAGGAPVAAVAAQGWDWEPAWQQYQRRLAGEAPTPQAELGFRPDFPAFANMPGEMKPLASPLFLSGASPRTERFLKTFLSGMGLEMMGAGSLAGSGGGTDDGPAPPLQNGSAVGVPMLSGDLSLAGVGTVTYCDGQKMIAFGHPMFSAGDTAAPMAQARIMGYMESYNHSFKLGDVGEVIGTIDQDRLFAIGGRIGAAPARVSVTIDVRGAGAGRPRTYHFSCWKDHNFMPPMLSAAVTESFGASVAENGELTARINYRLHLGDGTTIEKNFVKSAAASLVDGPVNALLYDLFLILENPFTEGDLSAVEVTIDMEQGLRQDLLVAARLEHDQYRPGETVRLWGRFRPWRGAEYERTMTLALPPALEPGDYVLHVADTETAQRIERAQHPDVFRPRDFAGVVRLAQAAQSKDNVIQLSLFEPALDMTLNGFDLKRLPSSLGMVIQRTASPQQQQQTVGRLVASTETPLDGPVAGATALTLRVVQHLDE